MASYKNTVIFDVLYGFVELTQVESEIISSPFYQRLKWIKQVGFSFYSFPGAEHSRFAHSIGVMYNAHAILQSIDKGVTNNYLFNSKHSDENKDFHQTVRLAALLHDLGTFTFSHTTEMAYIKFGQNKKKNLQNNWSDDHEHLGSYIIKNSDYEGGITHILKKYNIDPQKVSYLVKGMSDSHLANSILHSEIDCDRMDYLLRDAHYTGLKYGSYDRDYLLFHFSSVNIGNHPILVIKENALRCVEDFLMARFAWYSQVVRSNHGAKFDAIAEELTYVFLEKKLIYQYEDLLEFIKNDPIKFFSYNDGYFMNVVYDFYYNKKYEKNLKHKEMAESILFGNKIKTIYAPEFEQKILNQNDIKEVEKAKKRAVDKIEEIETELEKSNQKENWIIKDLPTKNVSFTKSKKMLVREGNKTNLLLERDPVKILTKSGDVRLLADMNNSVISNLQNSFNYIPHVYCSESAYKYLSQKGII